MTQDECCHAKYIEVMDFMEKSHRNSSCHRIEEHDILNWVNANRKKMKAEELKEE